MSLLSMDEMQLIKSLFEKKLNGYNKDMDDFILNVRWFYDNCLDCSHKVRNLNCDYLDCSCLGVKKNYGHIKCADRAIGDSETEPEDLDVKKCKIGDLVEHKNLGTVWKIIELVPQHKFPILAHAIIEGSGLGKATGTMTLTLEQLKIKYKYHEEP